MELLLVWTMPGLRDNGDVGAEDGRDDFDVLQTLLSNESVIN